MKRWSVAMTVSCEANVLGQLESIKVLAVGVYVNVTDRLIAALNSKAFIMLAKTEKHSNSFGFI